LIPGGLGSIPGLRGEFLWLTKRHWDGCFSENFGFSPVHIPSMPHTHLQPHAALTISNAVSRIGKQCTDKHCCFSLQASCRADGNAHDSSSRYCCGVAHRVRINGGVRFFPPFCLLLYFVPTRLAYVYRP
jgi:hypothetical protein